MANKILLVEDEKSIAEGIIYNLKNEGMKVTHVDEGPIALDLFEEEHFDLVILDIMLLQSCNGEQIQHYPGITEARFVFVSC